MLKDKIFKNPERAGEMAQPLKARLTTKNKNPELHTYLDSKGWYCFISRGYLNSRS